MNLLDKIDEVRANSVTPEEFEKAWGMSVEEYRRKINEICEEQTAEYVKAKTEKKAKAERPAAEAAVLNRAAAPIASARQLKALREQLIKDAKARGGVIELMGVDGEPVRFKIVDDVVLGRGKVEQVVISPELTEVGKQKASEFSKMVAKLVRQAKKKGPNGILGTPGPEDFEKVTKAILEKCCGRIDHLGDIVFEPEDELDDVMSISPGVMNGGGIGKRKDGSKGPRAKK